jgi:hypothetical protein
MAVIINAPPVKATANKSTAKQTAANKAESDIITARKEAVASLGQFAQIPLMITKQYADVGAVQLHWPKVSEEIAKLASTNDQVAKIVDPLMQVGPYAGLIAAVMPFVMQLAANHGRVTPGAAGTVSPVTLSSQVEASIAENELQALTIQRDAEQKAAAVRREIDMSRKALADAMRDQQQEATNGKL